MGAMASVASTCQHPQDDHAHDFPCIKVGIFTSSLGPTGFPSASCFISRHLEEREGRIAITEIITQCFMLLVSLL